MRVPPVLVAAGLALALPVSAVSTPARASPTAAGVAVPSTAADLSAVLHAVVTAGVPGAVALTDTPGRRPVAAAAGYADLARRRAMTSWTPFRIGSQTKTFVAVVLLQLAGEGRLSLDDTVEQHLPGLVPGGSAVTVRDLLQQTSGLYDYTDDRRVVDRPGHFTDPHRRWDPRELVAIAVSHPPSSRPGTTFGYSNTNYVLAGLIAERVGRRPIGELVEQRVLRPLHLDATSFPTRYPGTTAGMARGYSQTVPTAPATGGADIARWQDATDYDPSALWAAGAMVSTVRDMSRFYRALLGGRLLRPAQLRAMLTTVDSGRDLGPGTRYGLGIWSTRLPCGVLAWGHGGNTPDFAFLPLASRDGRTQVLASVNAQPGPPLVDTGALGTAYDALVQRTFCPAPAAAPTLAGRHGPA